MTEKNKFTPMMQHYLQIKKENPDAIIFYRLGDFYEMFFDDAKTASLELDLVLTGRNAGIEEKVPMCGVPHHAANSYIQRLIQKGYKVAIVEQVEDPALAKGLVQREVIRIVTPGTIMDENSDEKNTNYIASLYDFQYGICVVLCEMTTGEMKAQLIDKSVIALQKVLLLNNVKEIVVEHYFDKRLRNMIEEMQTITISAMNQDQVKEEYEHLLIHVNDQKVRHTFGLLMNYLDETQKRSMTHLQPIEMIYEQEFLQMDYATKKNLELTSSLHGNGKQMTLWNFMDHCMSAMGSRLLKKWIEYPLIQPEQIKKRQTAVKYLNDDFMIRDELKEHLRYVYDLERLGARVAYGSASPRDILRLIKTLEHAPVIFDIFKDCPSYPEYKTIDTCMALHDLIDGAIVEEPPLTIKDGGVFVDGYNERLDELRKVSRDGKSWILELEAKERERTGVKSLKIGYNRVFGYYIEVRKGNLAAIKPEFGYVRKQTLANAERYITEELKEKEDTILHAQEEKIRLEAELFTDLLNQIKVYLPKLHDLANALATIDVFYSLAQLASEHGYICPQFHKGHQIEIIEGKHPILESMMKKKRYVSNDLKMDEQQTISIITGPNMGGKSTFMRQNALLVIMAQIGSFVPAKSALLPVFDQIFTRIGASDDILSGKSTFMVEMMEANHALQHATENSLILFDEIGRGTSTYDGMALAQAMIEYIDEYLHAKTLFSTHYHELTQLGEESPTIHNLHVEVHEEQEEVTFLYRMIEGKADKSYGINVARLAKLPEIVLERAKQILEGLELQGDAGIYQPQMMVVEKEDPQMKEIADLIDMIDVNSMTPLDALNFLCELKNKRKK
ncbi:DNA mismatch repair protein MutS [Merdibacter massiliensis]|uniref:DNA mismatch repair protein MutS n=1 Tax=Merdibacter massiliensis TaxID=1871030 RepID=UPI00096A2746|nr:DNA mismatch repair protein MutS [Merdibacter massiliensis]